MKSRDLIFFTFWTSIPLVIILSVFLAGCSPAVMKESEIILEKVIEEELEEDLKGK